MTVKKLQYSVIILTSFFGVMIGEHVFVNVSALQNQLGPGVQ